MFSGIEGLLTIASAIPQHETCTIEITENSKYHASVALAKIYDDLLSDKERDLFREQCSAFFKYVIHTVSRSRFSLRCVADSIFKWGTFFCVLQRFVWGFFVWIQSRGNQMHLLSATGIVNWNWFRTFWCDLFRTEVDRDFWTCMYVLNFDRVPMKLGTSF